MTDFPRTRIVQKVATDATRQSDVRRFERWHVTAAEGNIDGPTSRGVIPPPHARVFRNGDFVKATRVTRHNASAQGSGCKIRC